MPAETFVGAKIRIPATFAVYVQPHGANRPLMPPLPDPVLGTIRCGTVEDRILRSGAQDLTAGAAPPCALMLSDGQDQATVSLEQ